MPCIDTTSHDKIIMSTLQIRIDDTLKKEADNLFEDLGLDTATAVRVFLKKALDTGGFPFPIKQRRVSDDLAKAISDTRSRQNLNGPYATAGEAVKAMLED